MSCLHIYNIDNMKSDFQNIINVNTEITNKLESVKKSLIKIKSIYTNLIKTNNTKIFLFCLDSFYFQYKTLSMEFDNFSRSNILINNRMYGDYYKLYNIIILQCKEKKIPLSQSFTSESKYPVYKDLEPFHEYNLEQITGIHTCIIEIINEIFVYYLNLEKNVSKNNPSVGISISNFLNTLEYENTLVREQISLYINYLSFFHSSQTNYLQKLFSKLEAFEKEIEEDILNNSNTRTVTEISIFDVNDTDNHQLNSYFIMTDKLIIDDSLNLEANTETLNNNDSANLENSDQEKECVQNIVTEIIENIEKSE